MNRTITTQNTKILSHLAALACICAILASSSAADQPRDDEAKKHRIEALYEEYRRNFADVAAISAEGAMTQADPQSLLFVDVRNQDEQDVSMLPGAITDREFLKNPEAYKNRTVIAY